jgi:tryptophan 2-monooxygenase
VGAGIAGMIAGYELLRMGVVPTIFEASSRIGGRAWSKRFESSGDMLNDIAELGAMRFPASSLALWHYLKRFSIDIDDMNFPNPGTVLTQIHYQDQSYFWHPNLPPPGLFAKISHDWQQYVSSIIHPFYATWKRGMREGNYDEITALWQGYLDQYSHRSFYQAVAQQFCKAPFHWTSEHINAFGSLGIGSGGFGPLFQANFAEVLRIMIQRWEEHQYFVKHGISHLTWKLYTESVANAQLQGSLASLRAVRLNSAVTDVQFNGSNPVISWHNGLSGLFNHQEFDAVIIATTSRAMKKMQLTTSSGLLEQKVKTALRNVHLIGSSKLFIRTATKFWKENPAIPQNIQTDELPRGVYALDYPQTKRGIVLVSYTWEDDSSKLLAMNERERFYTFKKILDKISPEFSRHLIPLDGEIIMVDWASEPHQYGAFKLQFPGQDQALHDLYYQFLSANKTDASSPDTGVYLAGDSVSWSGGWAEGAAQTAINAACAVAKRLGGTLREHSPLTQNPNFFKYDIPPQF